MSSLASPLRGSSSPADALSRRGWNPIKLAYKLAGWPAQLATSTFNQLSQYANSPGHRAYCYEELAPLGKVIRVKACLAVVTGRSVHLCWVVGSGKH